jgi:putative tryptophan/tyrosine transport system substrate-binding protein
VRYRGTRIFLLVLLLVSPVAAHGQVAPRLHRIGLLSLGSDPAAPFSPQWVAFLDGLRELGYAEDRNVRIERAFAGGQSERLPSLARKLVEQVDIMVVTGPREIEAARRATSTIPIVTIVAPDPVAAGVAKSLARPGGNITGLTVGASGVAQKYVELLREAVPSATRMAIVASRLQSPDVQREIDEAARALHVAVLPTMIVRSPEEFASLITQARRDGVGGIIVPNDAVANLHRARVVETAARHRMPAMYAVREFVEAGGLMAYGASYADLFRRAAIFVDKLLKGARPGDLPMEQPTKFELVVNLKAARALGLTLSPALLARAEVIE